MNADPGMNTDPQRAIRAMRPSDAAGAGNGSGAA
jgi:hypothetical protein